VRLNYIDNIDCLEGMKNIPDRSVDLIVTDPPYWHNKSMGPPTIGKKTRLKTDLYKRDGKMLTEMSDFGPDKITRFLDQAERVMKKMNCYIFCNDAQVATYGKWAEAHGCHFSLLVWRKPLSVINTNRFSQNAEFICRIYVYGTGLNYVEDKSYYDRVIDCKPCRGKNKRHPAQKPTDIIERLILLSSPKNGVILDPFMGSGSTAVACLHTGRNFIGFELDEEYHSLAHQRLAEAVDELLVEVNV
jgi:DNA modification methylase